MLAKLGKLILEFNIRIRITRYFVENIGEKSSIKTIIKLMFAA